MESSHYLIFDQSRYDNEQLTISDNKDFESQINMRVFGKTILQQDFLSNLSIDESGITMVKLLINDRTILNQCYKYMFDSNTIQKSIIIFL